MNEQKARFCAAYGCPNNSRMPNVQLFHFPENPERCKQFCQRLNREDLLERPVECSSYLICSEHFAESDFKTSTFLASDALPVKLSNTYGEPCSENFTSTELFTKSTIVQSEATKIKDSWTSGSASVTRHSETQAGPNVLVTEDHSSKPQKRNAANEINNSNPKYQRGNENENNTELEKMNIEIKSEYAEDGVDGRISKLIEWQNRIKNVLGCSSNKEYLLFALKMHCSSPQAYRCLQTVLKLPSESELKEMKVNIPKNLDDLVLEYLKLKIQGLPDTAKYCTLGVDEISINEYDTKSDQSTNFNDVNNDRAQEIANKAFMITLNGIYHEWRQPIAYALFDQADDFNKTQALVEDVINRLSGIGLKIKAIIANPDSQYDKYIRDAKGVTNEKPYLLYDNMKIYYILNVTRLMKSVRDIFVQNYLYYYGDKISWEYVEEIYENNEHKCKRLMPNITKSHVFPNISSKDDVKTAIQVLSRNVAVALHTYIDFESVTEEARPTANIIEKMNDLYDIMNSTNIESNNSLQSAFQMTKEQETILKEADHFFVNTEAVNKDTAECQWRLKSFQSFRISIQAVKMLYKDLRNEGFTYLPSRPLNLDYLDGLFASIRQQSSAHSAPVQLRRVFSKLFLSSLIGSPAVDCNVDLLDILLKAEDMMKLKVIDSDVQPPVSFKTETLTD